MPAEPAGTAPLDQSGSFEAGVAVVAVGGVALGLGVGTRILGAGAPALYALLCAGLALLAAVALPRRLSPRGRGRLRGWALAVVLLAGAALRFRGITFALPYVPHPDEPAVVNVAQRMLINGDLDPHRFIYPSFYIYLQVITYALHLAWGFTQGTYRSVQDLPNSTDIVTTAPGIYLWGRSLTALLGTGAIALVYGIGRRLYGPRAGLVAALLLAFAPSMIDDAHLITVDVPSAAFTALAFFWIVELYRAPLTPVRTARWWPIARAGIGVGLASATKYNAALVFVPLCLVPLLRGARAPWRVWLGGALAAAATFLAVTPFALPDLPVFLNDAASVITHYTFQGHRGFEGDHNWQYYAQYFWSSGRWTFALALLGLAAMALRHRRADLLVLPFPLLYYGTLAGLKVNFTRNLMPLYPFLALAGSVGLLTAAGWVEGRRSKVEGLLKRRQVPRNRALRSLARPSTFDLRPSTLLVLAILPAALAGPTATAGRLDNLRAQTDARVAAQHWMQQHLSRGVYWLVQLPPQQWYRDTNVVSTHSFGPITQHPPGWYPAHGFGYLLLSREEYGPALDDPAGFPAEAAWYRDAFARFPVVRVFQGPAAEQTLLSTELSTATMQAPRDARFGPGDGEIALLGYNLGPAGGLGDVYFPDPPPAVPAGPVRAGGVLGLTLLWQPLRAPRGDYEIFVHLRDGSGRIVAQRDTRPQNNAYATTSWRPGQPVIDSANLELPATLPEGRYTVVIGLYPPGQGRLPARPAPGADPLPDDELALATIEVVR